jgi:nitrogen-specific signal transduction histidine kinase
MTAGPDGSPSVKVDHIYIASQIAKAQGGRVDVRSNDCETCFRLRMPLTA